MSNVPYWGDIEASDSYRTATPEQKLVVLDGWEKDRYAEMPNLDPESKLHFEASVLLTKEKINNPEASKDELLEGLARRKQFDAFDYRNRFERTRKRDARIRASSLGMTEYLNEKIIFNDQEKNWINDNEINQGLDSSWVLRRGLDESNPNDFEINYALAALGKDEFTNKIRSQDDLDESEKNKIISNYDKYRAGAFEDFFGYITSKKIGTTGKSFQVDREMEYLNVEENPIFLTKNRLEELKEKGSVEAGDMESLVDNMIFTWAGKRGLDKDSLLDRSNPLRDQLKNLYIDSLLEHRDVWGEDEVARKDSSGTWVLNKNWAADISLSEEDIENKIKESKLDIPNEVLEKFFKEKSVKGDVSGKNMIDQDYMTFADES